MYRTGRRPQLDGVPPRDVRLCRDRVGPGAAGEYELANVAGAVEVDRVIDASLEDGRRLVVPHGRAQYDGDVACGDGIAVRGGRDEVDDDRRRQPKEAREPEAGSPQGSHEGPRSVVSSMILASEMFGSSSFWKASCASTVICAARSSE